MNNKERNLAVVTGACNGIGLELARVCAQNRFDLIIAAKEVSVFDAAEDLASHRVAVSPVRCDLSTLEGIDALRNTIAASGRPVDALIANAVRGVGEDFFDLDSNQALIDGTMYLIYQLGRAMRDRGRGRILVTGSIAGGLMPRSCHAVYNGATAQLASFSAALRNELKNSRVSVTCLMPGATDTNGFADPKDVATSGYDAMMCGEPSAVHSVGDKRRALEERGFQARIDFIDLRTTGLPNP